MKNKHLILLITPLILLSGCQDTSSSDSSSSSTTVEPTIIEQLSQLSAKMDELKDFGNKISYSQTQVDNYGAISITATQVGEGTLYNDNFYHEDFRQKIDEEEPINGIIEKGITSYQNNQVFYRTVYYGEDSDANKTSLYGYNEGIINQFMEVDFKYHLINNFINYSYNLFENNSSNKFKLETNILDLDFSTDGSKNIQFNFKMYDKTTIAIELNTNDTVTIENSFVKKCVSNYYVSLMNATNYQSVHYEASYSKDDSIETYKGTKLDPLKYIQEE